jgi:hypothetical protein
MAMSSCDIKLCQAMSSYDKSYDKPTINQFMNDLIDELIVQERV